MDKNMIEAIYNDIAIEDNKEKLNNNIGEFFKQKFVEVKDMDSSKVINVYIAFYNFMKDENRYKAALELSSWQKFFKDGIKPYFELENLHKDFELIITDERIINIMLRLCPENMLQFYKIAESKALDEKEYITEFESLKEKLINAGLIPRKENLGSDVPNVPHDIDMTAEELKNQEIELQEKRDAKRESIFEDSAQKLGLESDDLIKKVGVETSYDVDQIVITDELLDMFEKRASKVATVPKSTFEKIKAKITKKQNLKRMGIEVIEENNIKTLNLSKKDTLFDKIATTSKKVLNKIVDVALDVVVVGMIVAPVAKEMIEEALENTKKQMSKSNGETKKDSIKSRFEGLGNRAQGVLYKAVIGAGSAQIAAEDFLEDMKQNLEEKKQSVVTDTSSKIRKFADRLDSTADITQKNENIDQKSESSNMTPNTDEQNIIGDPIISENAVIDNQNTVSDPITHINTDNNISNQDFQPQEEIKESVRYVNTSKGKAKIVLRAATKAGEIPLQKENSNQRTIA